MLTTLARTDLVQVLEAERLRRASRMEAQQRLEADLRELVAILARLLLEDAA